MSFFQRHGGPGREAAITRTIRCGRQTRLKGRPLIGRTIYGENQNFDAYQYLPYSIDRFTARKSDHFAPKRVYWSYQ